MKLIMHVFGNHERREEVFKHESEFNGVYNVDKSCRRFSVEDEEHVYVVVSSHEAVKGLRGMRVARIHEDATFAVPVGWYELKKEIIHK